MIIGRICIKIKSKDIINFLIGQFDLIDYYLKVHFYQGFISSFCT